LFNDGKSLVVDDSGVVRLRDIDRTVFRTEVNNQELVAE